MGDFFTVLNSSIITFAEELGSFVNRNDSLNNIESSKSLSNPKDKKKIYEAIDSLDSEEEGEIEVVLTDGEKIKIMM